MYIHSGNLQSTLVPSSVGWKALYKTLRYHHDCSIWCIGFFKAFLLAYDLIFSSLK